MKWIKKAFNRVIEFKDENDQTIGTMTFKFLNRHIESELNHKKYFFDIDGFINKTATVLDSNRIELGKIELGFSRERGVMTLNNGEKYIWKRKNWRMTEWEVLRDLPHTDNDLTILNYDRTRQFLSESGGIEISENIENQELIILSGFFIGMYFLRKRRAGIIAAGS